jgi:hypothetical protein
MARNAKSKNKRAPKTVLKLPELEQSKSAVLNSLTSPSSQRSCDHAIREFKQPLSCDAPRERHSLAHIRHTTPTG